MNLLDIIPVSSKSKSKISTAKIAEHESAINNYTTTLGIINSDLKSSPQSKEITQQLLNTLNTRETNLIFEHFAETLSIPSNLAYGHYEMSCGKLVKDDNQDDLVKLSESPRAKLSDLIGISKLADMIVIPFDYLSPDSYSSEEYMIRETIKGFTRAASQHQLDVYVICPLRHYSILKHISAQDPNRQILANSYQQNFDVLSMMLPALLMCSDRLTKAEGEIGALSIKVKSLDSSMSGVIRGLESMDKQLKSLQEKIEVQRLEAIQLKFTQEQIKESRPSVTRADFRWFMAYEPLMFAVRKDADLQSATEPALIGPCWGPDFDKIVAASLEWKQIAGQRLKLSKKLQQLWY